MTPTRKIIPADFVQAVVTVPGSKSITNRALLIAALADGVSVLSGALDSEDTRIMGNALQALGIGLTVNNNGLYVSGQKAFPNKNGEIYVKNSGTTARFLTAALAFSDGHYSLDGTPRMRERPIADLLDSLRKLGADVQSLEQDGFLPLQIAPAQTTGGTAEVAGTISSQFLSALLMAAPLCGGNVRLCVTGELVSRPYIDLTLAVMRKFGAKIETDRAFTSFFIPAKTSYQPRSYRIEPDASAASYFFAIPAIIGGKITVQGLSKTSIQGDIGFVECLASMGCCVEYGPNEITVARPKTGGGTLAPLVGIDVDMNQISDTAQTLAVVALFAETPTKIRNIAHVRGKETDRIKALVTELRKFGAIVDEQPDGLTVRPNRSALHGARIATYDDHRMAMSFSLAGLTLPGVEIENPECTAKTYPNFFADLDRALVPRSS